MDVNVTEKVVFIVFIVENIWEWIKIRVIPTLYDTDDMPCNSIDCTFEFARLNLNNQLKIFMEMHRFDYA